MGPLMNMQAPHVPTFPDQTSIIDRQERRKYRRWSWYELPRPQGSPLFASSTVSCMPEWFFSDISPILQTIYQRNRVRYRETIAHLFKDIKHAE